ncbi:MAG: cytochrome [Alphaproteobacteria bacterium PA2]|nr:MAG: cytochrome [Alphaproteobacteria bacterium PA2]
MAPKGVFNQFKSDLIRKGIPLVVAVGRRISPVLKIDGMYWITRKEDVRQALDNPDFLEVPYGPEMKELSHSADGKAATFVLGLEGPDQARQNAIIRRIVLREDLDLARRQSRAFSESLLDGAAGRIDVITDFIFRVPTEICRRYFGLEFPNPNRFAEWSVAVSALLFADPTGDPIKRQLARAGALRLSRIIDVAIDKADDEIGQAPSSGETPFNELTLVQRLVWLRKREPALGLEREEIRAIILGLVVGFIPTNGLGAANMLEEVLGRSSTTRDARLAAKAQDDGTRMRDLLLEAGRRNPALAPGQWRYARKATVVGKGKWYQKTIPQGATVMVSTMSALADRPSSPRKPEDFELIFGHGVHQCLGQHLAMAIITEMFLALFARDGLLPAPDGTGALRRVGYFPRSMDMVYASARSTQDMIQVCIPITADLKRSDIETRLKALGNPARPDIASSLAAAGIVHFASASVWGEGGEPPLTLLLEFNVDGTRASAFPILARHVDVWLQPLLQWLRPGDGRSIEDVLRAHTLQLHTGPWGATGINFMGSQERSVAGTADQQRLRAAAEAALDRLGDRFGARPLEVLAAVRAHLRTDPANLALDALTVQPSRGDLAISTWRKPRTFWEPLPKVLQGGLGLQLVTGFLASFILVAGVLHFALGAGTGSGALAHWAVVTVLGLVLTASLWAGTAFAAYRIFLAEEDREEPDDQAPDPERVKTIIARENAPGYQQNHIIAVTPLKRGLIRRFAFAFAMWGIAQSLIWFRPGFVLTMGTIHFAKWFRMPGSRTMVFQSNYDGSWESYLEDFITRAHAGQTAAWSNGVGFPRSKGLIGDGAADGERFKRWVRRQQIPTDFWYCRFPELTGDVMRANMLIQRGLASAYDDTAARSWLDLFGSGQSQVGEIEAPEVQSLLFRGMRRAIFSACIPFTLPADPARRGAWLQSIQSQISYGKFPDKDKALFMALSAKGLKAFDTAFGPPIHLLKEFPEAFVHGMVSRGPILGDAAPADPAEPWLWADGVSEGLKSELVCDGVLMTYAASPEALDSQIAELMAGLSQADGNCVHTPIRTVTLDEKGDVVTLDSPNANGPSTGYEHFGFRDGISGPTLKGVSPSAPASDDLGVVEPGEFIFGYPNNQGHMPPCLKTPAESDVGGNLPVPSDTRAFGYPDINLPALQGEFRDFGRNGAFLVIRQLEQDAAGFATMTAEKAQDLNARVGEAKLSQIVGDKVTDEWVAAKLMGRWRDGRPLIGNPTYAVTRSSDEAANDFLYGRDDPQGHACPMGAHIRRANPRDSLTPNDPMEQVITRRHALMRRGRTYFYDEATGTYPTDKPAAKAKKGLLFVALCVDLERQFEMMQQTWLGFPSFHSLVNEVDPIATRSGRQLAERNFTIPTAAGPLTLRNMQSFITMKGGGYFFLPSRSAVAYLRDLCRIR